MDSEPTWDWTSVRGKFNTSPGPTPNPNSTQPGRAEQPGSQQNHSSQETPRTRPNGQRYGPRTCRVCLETEHPKFPTDTSTTFGISSTSSRPTYESNDPELGRLLSPCKCKGSQKYIHEGCLNAWRLANPTNTRNYLQCPTCQFTYRVNRLHWASMLSSKVAQVALTVLILIASIFTLGFIADPLFDLWFDPFGTLTDTVANVISDIEALEDPPYVEPTTWSEHFAKGFFSLGLVGLFKTMFAMTPWHWFHFRGTGIMGTGRRRGTGRARVENMNWIFILIGAVTFLAAVWRFVKALSARVLKNVSDRVLDVDEDDHDANTEDKKDQ